MKQIIIVFLVFIIALSCKKSVTEPKPNYLLNTIWTLESFKIENNFKKPSIDQSYWFQLRDDSTFSGMSDCLPINGPFVIGLDSTLNMIVKGTVFKNCGDNSIYLFFIETLSRTERFKFLDNKLYLYSNETIMIFNGK